MSTAFLQTPPCSLGSYVQLEKYLLEDCRLCPYLQTRLVGGRKPQMGWDWPSQGQGSRGLGHSYTSCPPTAPLEGPHEAHWMLRVEVREAFSTGGVILTQHLHQFIWEHLACSSSIIHSMKLLVPNGNPKLECGCRHAGCPA